jgi:sterol desaturase/sphingolipid hydroxylase (fatty acid hydroxylase superfamily)
MDPVNVIELAIPFFFLMIFLEIGLGYYRKKDFYRLNDTISDLSCGVLSQVAGIFFKIVTLGIYIWVERNFSIQKLFGVAAVPYGSPFHAAASFPFFGVNWPEFVSWAVVFVAVDFLYYWAHRTSHEVNILWAGHVVHHSSEEYNLSVALRQSSLHGLLTWIFYLPLALAGVPWQMYVVCWGLNLIYQFWIHTRAVGKLGWPEYVLNTPSLHRVHHGINPKYIDKNHAGVFVFWDLMFGTYQKEEEEPVYGLTVPINSWNPVWANVHGFADIVKNVRAARTWKDKWGILFNKPGWRPDYLGGYIAPREVVKSRYQKYNPPTPRSVALYALVHFAAVVVFTLPYLKAADADVMGTFSVLGGAAILMSLANLGGLFELRRWALYSEYARLTTIAVGAAVVMAGLDNFALAAGIFVFAVVSLVWLLNMRGLFVRKGWEPVMTA